MNTALAKKVEEKYLKKTPELRPGDTVRVHQKIKEGNKERIQVFEGVVLKVKGGGLKTTILVRKISYGIGVEKSYLLHSPNIAKIEIKKRAKVRKAYLTYLRALQGKSARLREKGFDALAVNVVDEPEELTSSNEAKDPDSPAKPASDNKVTDAEITELSEEEIADAVAEEVPLSEVEKSEEKQVNKEDEKGQDAPDEDHQEAAKEEVKEGIEKAEAEEAKEKDSEGEKAEKSKEEKPESEVAEEIKEEKE